MDASASHASHPLETHGVEELALEATMEHMIKMGKWRQAAAQGDRPHLQRSERAVDKPLPVAAETQPSRLAIPVWSEADEVAAELEELRMSEVWVDELAYTAEKGAPIQQVREFITSLTHLHHADFDMRFRQNFTKRWPLRLMMICKRGPAVRCRARLNVVRCLLNEDETFLEITTLKFKSMFHTELLEVVLEQGERGRHISGSTIFNHV